MRLFPFTFDDFPINDMGTIHSWFVDPFMWSLSSSTVGLIKRSGEFPAFGSVACLFGDMARQQQHYRSGLGEQESGRIGFANVRKLSF